MSARLQVILDEDEMDEIREAANRRGVTVSEWIRRALRTARRPEPVRDYESKLAVIRAAARHRFPAPDIETMLEEIEDPTDSRRRGT